MGITIVGAGAIGGVLGAFLIAKGEDVLLCDSNEEHVNQMNKYGLFIEGPSPEQSFTVKCRAVTPDQLVREGGTLETVLLCVKAHHTKEALKPIIPMLSETSAVVSVQNGLCEKQVAGLVGQERTIGCFVNFSADYLEPGKILYGGIASMYIGELSGEITPRINDLKNKLQAWGPVQATNNIWGYLWGKMSYAGLLYATALVDETMAAVVRNEEYRETLMELCSEILAVAKREGVTPIGFDDWEPALVHPRLKENTSLVNKQLERLAGRMAVNKKTKSGIWRDLAVRKRKTEVDAQLVPIVELGKQYGIPMPLTSNLIKQIKELESGVRQMSWHNLTELKGLYERAQPL